MSEKLDDFSKILLATSTINYMASNLNDVKRDYEFLNSDSTNERSQIADKAMKDGLENHKKYLASTLKRLCDTIEELGNYMDGRDMVCAIDERVYDAPLDILLHGKDEVENSYL